jgi:DMSO/TMAO reductase YedYZ molybdopterin-dependent catalytic subunit
VAAGARPGACRLARLAAPARRGAVFQLSTGVANVAKWYPFGFSFTATHYWVGWITIGALLLHVAAHGAQAWAADALLLDGRGEQVTGRPPGEGLSRRGLFSAVGAAVGAITLTQVGGTLEPLKELAVLSPRRPDVGPQSFPVNRTARSADVVAAATSADYRLVVEGRVPEPLELTLADLQSLPQTDAELAIACVEGWSASAVWSGIRVRDLLRAAGADTDRRVQVRSLQPRGNFRNSELDRARVQDPLSLLALRLRGEELHLDHGFPARLIAPNRPGVLQTKWVHRWWSCDGRPDLRSGRRHARGHAPAGC